MVWLTAEVSRLWIMGKPYKLGDLWGDKTFSYDGVSNRTQESTTLSGSTVTDTYAYPGTSNRLTTVMRGVATIRAFAYAGDGNIPARLAATSSCWRTC
jgi:hypothetical protein